MRQEGALITEDGKNARSHSTDGVKNGSSVLG